MARTPFILVFGFKTNFDWSRYMWPRVATPWLEEPGSIQVVRTPDVYDSPPSRWIVPLGKQSKVRRIHRYKFVPWHTFPSRCESILFLLVEFTSLMNHQTQGITACPTSVFG